MKIKKLMMNKSRLWGNSQNNGRFLIDISSKKVRTPIMLNFSDRRALNHDRLKVGLLIKRKNHSHKNKIIKNYKLTIKMKKN